LNLKRFRELLISNWPAKIISVAAALVLFMFYRINTLEERFFSVPLTVDPPVGLSVANPYPRSVRIRLRGREETVFPILEDDIKVHADFARIKSEGEFRVPLRVSLGSTALGVAPLEIKVEPTEITLYLEYRLDRSVEIVPVIRGLPAHGYELVQYTITPSFADILGPRSQIQALDRLMTEEIDVTGRSEDFLVRVRIASSNPLVTLPGGRSVEFQGIIREAEIIKSFDSIDIISIDLAADLKLADSLPRGSIRLQGTQLSIENLAPSQLRLVVDCSEVERPGTARLLPQPDIPPGYAVLKYDPQELVLRFIPAGPAGTDGTAGTAEAAGGNR
jgi:hypothetical protein